MQSSFRPELSKMCTLVWTNPVSSLEMAISRRYGNFIGWAPSNGRRYSTYKVLIGYWPPDIFINLRWKSIPESLVNNPHLKVCLRFRRPSMFAFRQCQLAQQTRQSRYHAREVNRHPGHKIDFSQTKIYHTLGAIASNETNTYLTQNCCHSEFCG